MGCSLGLSVSAVSYREEEQAAYAASAAQETISGRTLCCALMRADRRCKGPNGGHRSTAEQKQARSHGSCVAPCTYIALGGTAKMLIVSHSCGPGDIPSHIRGPSRRPQLHSVQDEYAGPEPVPGDLFRIFPWVDACICMHRKATEEKKCSNILGQKGIRRHEHSHDIARVNAGMLPSGRSDDHFTQQYKGTGCRPWSTRTGDLSEEQTSI